MVSKNFKRGSGCIRGTGDIDGIPSTIKFSFCGMNATDTFMSMLSAMGIKVVDVTPLKPKKRKAK